MRLMIPLALLLVGILVTALGVRVAGDMRASRDWPSTAGTVEAADVTMRSEGNENKRFGAQVRYRYEVAGRAYTGERVSFESGLSPVRGLAEAAVARYAPGSTVRVFYDPARPDRAVLEPGGSSITSWLIGAVGVVMSVAGVAGLLARLR